MNGTTSNLTAPNSHQAANNVAMLIDWENIKAAAMEHLRTPPDIITLKKIARQYGSLRVARAYANWTDSSRWHVGDVDRLAAQGIEPVFVATRHFQGIDHPPDEPRYEKDLVDLRLACDGMELLALHSEIACFVVVSGDGALETLFAKLSARGKRVIRVAVKQSLPRRVKVLGEERVMYDDWTKGFQMRADQQVNEAVSALTDAVTEIAGRDGDTGLQAVKEYMRLKNPEFEEEKLGIPTFRHLAYLAELRGKVRVDASTEPARAELSENENLPSGNTWREFIRHLDASKEYSITGLEASLVDVDLSLGNKKLADLIDFAVASDVLVKVIERQVVRDKSSKGPRTVGSIKYRLNPHHPRVQVILAET